MLEDVPCWASGGPGGNPRVVTSGESCSPPGTSSTSGTPGGQQVGAGTGDAGADRPDPHAADVRGLCVGVAQDLGENQSLPALLGEVVEQSAGVDELGPRLSAGGVGGDGVTGGVLPLFGGLAGPGHVMTHAVDPGVPGQRKDPGTGRGPGGEPGQCLDDPQVGFLGEVVGPVGVGEVGEQSPHVPVGGLDEVGQGLAVT